MDTLDLIIGLTLMNAMPHFVLGTWKGRMFSAFGFGDTQNILYGWLNFGLSFGLFLYTHGPEQLLKNSIYAGALAMLLIYFMTGWFWYRVFHKRFYAQRQRPDHFHQDK